MDKPNSQTLTPASKCMYIYLQLLFKLLHVDLTIFNVAIYVIEFHDLPVLYVDTEVKEVVRRT